jgi:hypothetical protein
MGERYKLTDRQLICDYGRLTIKREEVSEAANGLEILKQASWANEIHNILVCECAE